MTHSKLMTRIWLYPLLYSFFCLLGAVSGDVAESCRVPECSRGDGTERGVSGADTGHHSRTAGRGDHVRRFSRHIRPPLQAHRG